MRKHIKLAAAALAVSTALIMSVPVMAADFTTSDSVLTLQTPDDTWAEIHDPDTWVTLGNGNDTITLLHYSNGESLPAITVAGEHYSKVCQTVLSTKNEVFLITGSVVDATNFPAVRKAVESIVINKYDTKTAVGSRNSQPKASYTVEGADKTCYVTSSGLNVRSDYSTTAARIGSLSYGDAVHVTGVVNYGGDDAGWYRIDYNGGESYIASQFVSSSKPEPIQEASPEKTGNELTMYSSDGSQIEIYEYDNGTWLDNDGAKYVAEGAGQWSCEDGSYWTTSPQMVDNGDNDIIVLSNSAGNSVTIYLTAQGTWTDADSILYTAEGAGRWTDANGGVWSSN